MFYGAVVWDPWLILSQIVCIQCLHYMTLGLLLWCFLGLQLPAAMSLKYFFDYTLVSLSSTIGWSLVLAFLLNALAGAGLLFLLVERAKKCLDFSATVYIVHLLLCVLYAGFPSTFLWWLLNAACLAATSLLGEWLCMKRELRDIPMRSARASV